MRSIKDAALAFDRACAASEVDYALIGGFAVMAWGQPRATMDVDAMVHMDRDRIEGFAQACRDEGFRLEPQDLRDALDHGGHATAFDEQSPYHVDVEPAGTPQEVSEVESALEVSFDDGRLRVARAEDTVAFKLAFGTPQDLADARSILVRQEGRLDLPVLRAACRRLGVHEALERLLADARRK